jgi:hypothetical protein
VSGRWRGGQTVVWREVLHGRPWFLTPVTVVEDRPDLLAVYLAEGAPFAYPQGDLPEHPWAQRGKTRWHGHGILLLYRPGDWCSVWAFWRGKTRNFAGWYVNFEEPWRRSPDGFDKLDLALDIWIPDGGEWIWKDREQFERLVREGFYTAEQAGGVRAESERVAARLDRGERWWDESWARWAPDPAWPVPELPDAV